MFTKISMSVPVTQAATMGGEDRGGLPNLDPNLSKSQVGHPDPDPDLSKSRGGHPESRDEKVGENRDISRFIPTYLAKKNQEKSGYIPILPNFGLKSQGESRYMHGLNQV